MARSILYVHGMGTIGGAEHDLLLLLRELDREAWNPRMACLERGPFRASVAALNIPVSPVTLPPWRKLSSLFSRYAACRRLSALLEEAEPALVHVNDLWWVPHTVCAAKSMKHRAPPVIAHVRQAMKPEKAQAYALDRVDYVLAVSRQVQGALEQGGVPPERVETLYSGVDLTACSGPHDGEHIRNKHDIPSNALLIGTVANLLAIKGYEVMIEALPAVVEQVPSAHYMIVGGGSDVYRERLRQLCADRGLAARVHLVGFQDPVWPYLAAMDLYVQPSFNEGFGLAAVEAMAMGKAVVATGVGGLPEVVADGETGLLVSSGDATGLSRAVLSLLHDRSRRERMGSMGVTRARERFDLKNTVAGIERVYRDVLVRRRPR